MYIVIWSKNHRPKLTITFYYDKKHYFFWYKNGKRTKRLLLFKFIHIRFYKLKRKRIT